MTLGIVGGWGSQRSGAAGTEERAGTKRTKPAKHTKHTKPAKGAALPAALATRAKAAHAAKLAQLTERARAAVALVREKQADIAANMVDIGLALNELEAEGMAAALGRASFAEVCEKDLRMGLSTAHGLISLATKVPRAVVRKLGPERARAILDLVEATPADDAPEQLLSARLALPSGRTLDVAAASTREIRDAAKEFRGARLKDTGGRSRGFTTTPDEKRQFARLARELSARGHERARLLATRGGAGARVRFEAPLADLAAFAAALRDALKKA